MIIKELFLFNNSSVFTVRNLWNKLNDIISINNYCIILF